MEIKTKDIRKIFDVIMNTIEESGNSTVNINYGTYWSVGFEEGQKVNPPEVLVSDLRDEWETLQRLIGDDTPVYMDCERLGKILAAIGLKLDL